MLCNHTHHLVTIKMPKLYSLIVSLYGTFVSSQTASPASNTTPPKTSPTSSPVEFSNVTSYNDGQTYTMDYSHGYETFVITYNTNLVIEEGGKISAPPNSDWPAIRLSVGSTLNATGGIITGSNGVQGGDAIQLNNGQSSTETSGYGEFYDGVKIVGGNATDGTAGDALIVHGFGTDAFIYGGEFIGGSGAEADGSSVKVYNSATVHIYGGFFQGDMLVDGNGMIALHGCFSMKNSTFVTGIFADDTELSINIITGVSGTIYFALVQEQECDTAPSVAPTSFPTLTSKPTVVQSSNGNGIATFYALFSLIMTFIYQL